MSKVGLLSKWWDARPLLGLQMKWEMEEEKEKVAFLVAINLER